MAKKILKLGSENIIPITRADCVYMPGTSDTLVNELSKKSDVGHKHSAIDVGARPSDWVPTWNDITNKPSTFVPILGETSTTAYRGDKGKIAYDHSQAAHAPVNAQANADITQAEIEAKLTGSITSHNHNGQYYTETEVDNLLAGKADSEHGTHVNEAYATAAPKAAGTAAAGISTKVAREDHVHPLQTTISGNAGSATKLETARNITIGDADAKAFDGTDNLSWTLDEIGAAPKVHRHDDLYYTITVMNTQLAGKANNGHGTHLPKLETADNARFLRNDNTWATVTPANIGAAAEGHTHDDRYYTESEIDTKVETLKGKITAAETAAQKYADDAITALVDSAPDAMNTLNELATAINKHQNVYDAYVEEVTTALNKKADVQHGTHVNEAYATAAPKAAGTAAVGTSAKVAREDHVHPLQTTVSGNAGSANKVNNALSIQLNGGTATSFDGSDAKSINITPASIGAAANHNHDAYVNKNAFANIKVGSTTVAADAVQDTVELVAGTNVTLTPDATNDKITITAKDTTYGVATTSANGLMSSSDKSKLDGIASGANAYTHPSATAYSSGLYKVTVDNTGHVTKATAVTKADITGLGIPGSDTNTWRGVQDNLTSTATDQSLSANQGKVLKGLIDSHTSTTHLALGTTFSTAFRGDYGNTAYTHSQAVHAPSNAQKNSDITKSEIEAKLTGNITTHTHSAYAASSHTHSYAGSSSAGGAAYSADALNVYSNDTVTTTATDTTTNWGKYNTSVHWYTTADQLTNQPSQWGYLLNVGQGSEVHQLWMTQASGDMLHRGGNGSGWSGTWRKILDETNFKTANILSESELNTIFTNVGI